jgi:vacuolar iron transporter family protein
VGIVPLAPYAFGLSINTALHLSIGVTSLALLIFGAVKGKFTSIPPLKSALETFMVGSVAAGAVFVLARLLAGH